LRVVPNAQVSGQVGRQSSFEVTLNNNLVYSKLKVGSFPKFDEIVKLVAAAK
jgi:selT/selW/selH-like putative selenoprotein